MKWTFIAQIGLSLDGGGIQGSFMQYALFFALMGSALISYVYFWCKGRLDMDESPKLEMMIIDEYPKNEDLNGK